MAVVNEAFVKHYFPNGDVVWALVEDPVTQERFPGRIVVPGSNGWLQIIGVTGDALDDGLDKPVKPAIYLPYTVNMWVWTQILVRSRVDPRTITHSVRQQIVAVNPDQQAEYVERRPARIAGSATSRYLPGDAWCRSLFAIFFGARTDRWPRLGSTAWFLILLRSAPMNSASAWRSARRAATCSKSCSRRRECSVGLGIAAGLALSFALNRLLSHLD